MAQLNVDLSKVPPAVAPSEPNRSRVWSANQNAVFDFVEHGTGNAIVNAVAGSGKTTTIVEALSRVQGSSIFLAFNKSIAEELKARGVNARTFHSLTYSPVTRLKNTRQVDPDKLRKIMRLEFKGNDEIVYGSFCTKLVSLAKQVGMGALIRETPDIWMHLVDFHDLEVDHEDGDLGRGMQLASHLLQLSNESPMVDFDDLLYLAVKEGLSLPKFDFVFVDEAQDTNAIQRAILRKIMIPGRSRMVAVGDPAQAIYGFRGADSNSLRLIAEEFDAIELPLTVSYRCATSIVAHARTWVDHIEPAPTAPVGLVEHLGTDWNPNRFQALDLIVCRTTKPLVSLGYKLLRAHVPARILGKEIGRSLCTLIEKQKAKGVDALVAKLEIWREREVEKARARQDEGKVDAVHDKVDAIVCLIEGLPETKRTIPALLEVIGTLFSDAAGTVTLATIHKAKGLEAETVYWLNSSQQPCKWAKQEWQQDQERNLCYVAATRAKSRLVLIEDGSAKNA